MDPRYLTVEELSKVLHIGKGKAYELVKDPSFFPAFRIGKRILVDFIALDRWIKENAGGKSA